MRKIVTAILDGPLPTASWKDLEAVLTADHLLLLTVSAVGWDLSAHRAACLSFNFS